MRIHSILEGTRVNGPGYRLGIWVQGCRRNCPGCFNREALLVNLAVAVFGTDFEERINGG